MTSASPTDTVPTARQRVVDRARQVAGYTMHWQGASFADDAWLAAITQGDRDLTGLTAGQELHLVVDLAGRSVDWAARLAACQEAWQWPRRIVLVVPAGQVDDALFDDLTTAFDKAPAVALRGFDGSPGQVSLLPRLHHVVVDPGAPDLAERVATAHEAHVKVVVADALTAERWADAFEADADLVVSGLAPRDALRAPGNFSAGELNSMEMLQILEQPEPDLAALTGLVAADPALSVAVLRLVNSPAVGLRRQVDSVRQATVLAGPRHLRSIAVRALIGASRSPVDDLWAMLTRALVVWDLTGDDAGYTAGMLSALADLRRFPPRWLAAQAKLSATVAAGMCGGGGPIGEALADVITFELGGSPARFSVAELAQLEHAASYEALEIARALR